jgi:uncharacterized membrane protein YraQ (UPF0718 family)
MQRSLGDHRPPAVVRASLFGMASSSCSYAASALARTLFVRGADFTTAMVFMVASTNLVVELGIVLWLLLGWQFAVAEFVGGVTMIGLLAVALPRLVPTAWTDSIRGREASAAPVPQDHAAASGTFRRRIREPARWRAAAGFTLGDLTMLRREIVIGFLVAGFLAVAVPAGVWNAAFLHGHGAATTIEDAIVGPAIAIVSFVCSIGNVPLAAALWKQGVSFGGVVAFVFADLISLPLLLVYRKLYGGRLTARLLGCFWLVMSLAGLLTELIFRALGGVPTARPRAIATQHFAWDHTTVLNIVMIAVLAGAVRLRRQSSGRGGHAEPGDSATPYARDPVCGMQVERAHATTLAMPDRRIVSFCSTGCRDHYLAGSAHPSTATRSDR